MAISLFVPWGDRKTRQRLPPSQPTEAKTWHCQDDRERKEEDEVWPSLRVKRSSQTDLVKAKASSDERAAEAGEAELKMSCSHNSLHTNGLFNPSKKTEQ
ncbi:unnamed protein product [Pleuronectes platessa]|uniref:Uncharacterized protein n=1 Tax=Pleuronectes platessa TaxID=8262 RepID=A0A9N7UG52_PLEPL|nr:unnamed protein product [Pleuronectes platessa]